MRGSASNDFVGPFSDEISIGGDRSGGGICTIARWCLRLGDDLPACSWTGVSDLILDGSAGEKDVGSGPRARRGAAERPRRAPTTAPSSPGLGLLQRSRLAPPNCGDHSGDQERPSLICGSGRRHVGIVIDEDLNVRLVCPSSRTGCDEAPEKKDRFDADDP